MNAIYLGMLGADVRNLVLDIENYCGFEIEIDVDPERVHGGLGSDASETEAKIFTGLAGHFPEASAYHELRHIQRVLVEGIPRLVVGEDAPFDPNIDRGISSLDNNLEHLSIVPEECERYPERRGYWEGRVAALLGRLEQGQIAGVDRRHNALTAFLLVQLMVNNAELRARCDAVLAVLGLLQVALELRAQVVAANGSKQAIVLAVFAHWPLPLGLGALETYDVHQGSAAKTPLAELAG